MFRKAHPKRKAEEKKIKTESGKRLYALLQEDLSHSRRMKMILKKAVVSLAIVFIILFLLKFFV